MAAKRVVLNREEFERLRDLPDKRITKDIRLTLRRPTAPALIADDITIENGAGVELRLTIHHNPEVGSTTFNVDMPGTGPICRLDVDGPRHEPCGRSHKHSLQNPRSPERNLRDNVEDRPDLSGKPVRALFATFCELALIVHDANFSMPDRDDEGTES